LASIFDCQRSQWPIKYLGVPLHWQKLGSNDWDSLVSKRENRLQGWKEGEVKANDI
jgi:hypothetical protein